MCSAQTLERNITNKHQNVGIYIIERTFSREIPMDWGRKSRPYLSSGNTHKRETVLWNHVDRKNNQQITGIKQIFLEIRRDITSRKSMNLTKLCAILEICVSIFFAHRNTELWFALLSLRADAKILWVPWISVCKLYFLSQRRKGCEVFIINWILIFY